VALNLGNAYYWVGHVKRARDLLAPYEQEASYSPDAYIFHARLADVYEECGQSEEALKQWIKGDAAALVAGDREYIAYCAAGLGTYLQNVGGYRKAEVCFERAQAHEPDLESRVILLRQLLDVLLEQRKEKRAGEVFNEANAIAAKEDFRDQRIDLHMRLFDYDWPKSLAHKKQALKLWAFALLYSFAGLDTPVFAQIAGHGVAKLTTPGLAPTPSQFKKLSADLLDWVEREFTRSPMPREIVASQLSIIEELLPHVGNRRTLAVAAKEAFRRAGQRFN
jgi:tetratricopeptide (TPR) repeat protein